jgi:hypothetical protein
VLLGNLAIDAIYKKNLRSCIQSAVIGLHTYKYTELTNSATSDNKYDRYWTRYANSYSLQIVPTWPSR